MKYGKYGDINKYGQKNLGITKSKPICGIHEILVLCMHCSHSYFHPMFKLHLMKCDSCQITKKKEKKKKCYQEKRRY